MNTNSKSKLLLQKQDISIADLDSVAGGRGRPHFSGGPPQYGSTSGSSITPRRPPAGSLTGSSWDVDSNLIGNPPGAQ